VIKFEWDEAKNKINRKKHGVWFEEAQSVFLDQQARVFLDTKHSIMEERFLIIGNSFQSKLLFVVHCYRKSASVVRIISARKVTKKERQQYEEGI
jgi:uncharacterized DUF497 family protein